MAKKRLVFLGSKPIGYRCFQYIAENQDKLGIDCVGLLYYDRGNFASPPWLETAKEHDVSIIHEPDHIPECEILYSVQYHQILKKAHIDTAGLALNLHMAPLPEFRGSNAFSMAIIEGKKEFGTTVHVMDEKTDHGDILFQKRFPIPPSCWVEELYEVTMEASYRLFVQTLPSLVSGNFRRLPQKDLIPSLGSAFHFRHEIHSLKEIDLSWDPEKIERYIRATSMPGFPPPFCWVAGQKVFFSRANES